MECSNAGSVDFRVLDSCIHPKPKKSRTNHPFLQNQKQNQHFLPFFGSKLGKPFIFSRFSISLWLLYVCEICDAAPSEFIGRIMGFQWGNYDWMAPKPQWFNNLRFNSVSQFHFKEILAELVWNETIFELWMNMTWLWIYTIWINWWRNSYGSVNPLLINLLKKPCCAFNLKIMDWVLPKHWFTGRIIKFKAASLHTLRKHIYISPVNDGSDNPPKIYAWNPKWLLFWLELRPCFAGANKKRLTKR